MKFCYLDESGTGGEPIAVMAGVILDSQRMHILKDNWKELLQELSNLTGREIKEIHTKDFYPGNSPWRGLSADQRSEVIEKVFGWIKERKHQIVYTAIDIEKYNNIKEKDKRIDEVGSLWQMLSLHITLSIQKRYQSEQKNKGNTLLVFDRKNIEEKRFGVLLNNPPDWIDTFYKRGKKDQPLNQIIDVPYFGDSEEVGLIQLADFVCFFLRKYYELSSGKVQEKYEGEAEKIEGWLSVVFERALPKSNMYPTKGRCECAELFWKLAPSPITGA